MPCSQNKVASHRRRKRLLARAKGYWGARSKVLTIAKHHLDKAGQHAYRDRRLKKREFLKGTFDFKGDGSEINLSIIR